jgi:hypothetical protein
VRESTGFTAEHVIRRPCARNKKHEFMRPPAHFQLKCSWVMSQGSELLQNWPFSLPSGELYCGICQGEIWQCALEPNKQTEPYFDSSLLFLFNGQ